MKRTSKILVLVLSLALVFGAVAVIASAASDVTLKGTADFEKQNVGTFVKASDKKDVGANGVTFVLNGRVGQVDIAQGSDGNKYAVFTQTDFVKSSGPYAYMSTGSNASVANGKLTIGNNDISNYKYLSYEVDLMSPTGKFMSGNLDPSARAIKSGATSRDFWNTNANQTIVKYGSDDKGSYLVNNTDSSMKMYVNPYEFTHVQIILENTTKEGDTNIGLTSHVYVNGEFWFSKVATNVPTNYHSDTPHAAFIEFKINYSTADDPTQTLAIDNVKFSTVPAGSETAVEELVAYDADNRPAGLVVANVNGVDYNTLEGAIAAAAEGSTINVLVDKATPTTVSKNIVLNSGDKTLNIKAGEGYQLTAKDGIYKVTKVLSGITTKKTDDFGKLVGAAAADGKDPSGTSYTWSFKNRYGIVEKGVQADGNSYLLYTNKGWKGSSGPYFGTGYGGAGTTARPTVAEAGTQEAPASGALNAPGSIENYPYLVFDVDVASPNGELVDASINLQTRYATGAKYTTSNGKTTWGATLDANNHGNGATAVVMGTDATGSYIKANNKTLYVDAYKFTHITVVYEGVLTETNASYRTHVYINGEYFTTYTEKTNKNFYEKPHLTWDEVRFNFGSSASINKDFEDGRTLAVDNAVTRILDTKYQGNLATVLASKADITAWDGNVYDANFAPIAFEATPAASIGEVNYFDINEAFAALKDGDTIKILKDIVATVEINKPFVGVTIDKGDFALNLVAGEQMEITNEGNVYTAKELMPKLFQYLKGGKLVYGFGTLKAAIAAADAGSTVKLLADVNIIQTTANDYIDIGKKLTLDLNGYTIKAIAEGSKLKVSLFRMNEGTDLTVTSSRMGGKIFSAGWNSATSFGSNGVFTWPNNTAILRINGNIDGKPALAIYAGCLTAAYSNAVECHIDGGMYVNVIGDMNGFIESRKVGRDSEVKNAIFYTSHNGGVFGYTGRNTAVDDYGHIAVDNCVIIGHLTNAGFVAPQVMDVTNTYITGNVNVIICKDYATTVDGEKPANVPGTVTLGAGVYVGGTISSNVQIADGYALHDVNVSKEFTYDTHAWKKGETDYTFDASSFDATSVTKSLTFKKVVGGDAVTATWKDAKGNVLGTSTVYTGTEAIAPAGLKAAGVLVEGWLDYVPGEWNESLLVPAGVTEITFTEKEGGKKVGIPAVQLLFNVKLTTHFEYHLYIPVAAEGISVTAVDLRGDRLARYNSFVGTKYTFAGEKYTMVDAWPGYTNAALENSTAGVTFTYDGVTYNVAANVNMVKYTEYVLDAGNGYGETAKDLVANVANYLVTGNKILGKSGEGLNKLQALVDANADRLIHLTDEEKVIPDTTKIAAYVSGAQLISDAYGPRFRFTLTDAGKAAKIALTKTGASGGTDAEYKTLGYIDTNNTLIYNVNNTVIEVTPAEGAKITLTFDLGNYYALLAATGATADQLAFVDAMYGYAIAGGNY